MPYGLPRCAVQDMPVEAFGQQLGTVHQGRDGLNHADFVCMQTLLSPVLGNPSSD
jgi:hypothetical protein